jgi:hypothetical protein
MSGLKIAKKKAIQLLKEKVTGGETIAQQIGTITNVNQYSSVLDIHESWWQATGNLLRQIFDDDTVGNEFQYTPLFVPDNPPLPQKIQRFQRSTKTEISRLYSIIDNINKDVYPVITGQTLYEKVITQFKDNPLVVFILIAFLIIGGALTIIHQLAEVRKDFKPDTTPAKQANKDSGKSAGKQSDSMIQQQHDSSAAHYAHFIVSIDSDHDLAREITDSLHDISFIGYKDVTVRITYYPNPQPVRDLYTYRENGYVVAKKDGAGTIYTFKGQLITSPTGPSDDNLISILNNLNQQVASITRRHKREITAGLRRQLIAP